MLENSPEFHTLDIEYNGSGPSSAPPPDVRKGSAFPSIQKKLAALPPFLRFAANVECRYYLHTKMSKKALDKFFSSIAKSSTEEDVKNAYARYFKIEYNTAHKHDLFTPNVFFEFKYNKNFQNLKTRATVLAQCMYYVRRLKFGTFADMPVPYYLCMADQNEAMLTETKQWGHFYDDAQGKYDWDLAPSTPDANLIDDLAMTPAVRNMHIFNVSDPTGFSVFSSQMEIRLNPQQLLFGDRKLVTEENFENVFKYWNDEFGEAVRNGFKTSRYFVADIQEGRSIFFRDQNKVHFNIGDDDWKEKKIMAPGYEHFWSIFDRVHDPDVVRGVLAKIDRLTDEELRRFYGEFFTPLKVCKKGARLYRGDGRKRVVENGRIPFVGYGRRDRKSGVSSAV